MNENLRRYWYRIYWHISGGHFQLSMLKTYSPLRYPGWKNKLSKFISAICIDNGICGHYVEPYAGWASVALHLLIEQKVQRITINDLDKAIYAFWYSILNHTEDFCDLIHKTEVSVQNWRIMREINKNKDSANILELGFSTFFLNRTNISWILDAGPIWWLDQQWTYKIDCRFNKKTLIEKILLIAKHKGNIDLYNLDAIELVERIRGGSDDSRTIFYFDPPYYMKGASLYLSHYKNEQHLEVSEAIKKIKNIKWVVSYDDTPNIESIYSWVPERRVHKYSFNHTAHTSKKWNEILFFSEGITFSPQFLPS